MITLHADRSLIDAIEKDKREEAIAFAEWILQEDIVEFWQEDGKRTYRSTMYDLDGKDFTAKELYDKYKSKFNTE